MKTVTPKSQWYSSLLIVLVVAIVSVFTACASTENSANKTTYYFLRHAEIDKENPDKPLNSKGQNRAQVLAEHFNGLTITDIYATHTDRTYDTVRPLADNRGLEIRQVPKQGQNIDGQTVTNRTKGKVAIEPMLSALQGIEAGNSVVVAANSGNLFALMAGIGVPVVGDTTCANEPSQCLPCKSKKCFPGEEFNNIWTVSVATNGKVRLQRAKYGD